MAGKEVTYKINFEAEYNQVKSVIEKFKKEIKKTDFSLSVGDTNELVKQMNYIEKQLKEGIQGTEFSVDMDKEDLVAIVQQSANIEEAFKDVYTILGKIGNKYNKSFDSASADEYRKRLNSLVEEYQNISKEISKMQSKTKALPDNAPKVENIKDVKKSTKDIEKAFTSMGKHVSKSLDDLSGRSVQGFKKQIEKVDASIDTLRQNDFISEEQAKEAKLKIKGILTAIEKIKKEGYSTEGLQDFKSLVAGLNSSELKQIQNIDLDSVVKDFEQLGDTKADMKILEDRLGLVGDQLKTMGIDTEKAVDGDKIAKEIDKVVNKQEERIKTSKEVNETLLETEKIAGNAYKSMANNNTKVAKETLQTKSNVEDVTKAYEDLGKKASYIIGIQLFNLMREKLTSSIRDAIDSVKDLDESLTEIATVTGRTRESMWSNFEEFNIMAKQLGVTTQAVVDASVLFYRQGKSTAEVMEMVRASTISASIASIETSTASDRLTAALNGFRLEASQAMNVADKFAALAANSASSFDELSIALTKNAAASYSAGIDMDHMLGYLAKVIETTREAPTSVGTAFKTIIARAQQLKEIGEVIDEETGESFSLNRVDKALKEVGVTLVDSSGQLRDLQNVLDELGGKWDGLDRNQRAYIATMMAGTRMQSRFFALMNDYDRTLELVQTSQTSVNAATEQFNTHVQGIEAAINKLKATWEEFKVEISDTGTMQQVISVLTKLAELATTLEKKIGFLNIALAMLAGKGMSSLLRNFTFIRQFISNLGPVSNLTEVMIGKISQLGIVSKATAGAQAGLAASLTTLIPVFLAVAATVGAVLLAFTLYRKHQEKLKEQHEDRIGLLNLNEALEDSLATYEKYNSEIKKTINTNKQIIGTLDTLADKYKDINTTMEERARIAQQLATTVELDKNFIFSENLTTDQLKDNNELIAEAVELEKQKNLEKLKGQILEKESFARGEMDDEVDNLEKSIALYEDFISARDSVNVDNTFNFDENLNVEKFERNLEGRIAAAYASVAQGGEIDTEAVRKMELLQKHLKQMSTEAEKINFLSDLEDNYSKTNSQAQKLAETIERIKNDTADISFDKMVYDLLEDDDTTGVDALEKMLAFTPGMFEAIENGNKKDMEEYIVRLSKDATKFARENDISLKELFESPEMLSEVFSPEEIKSEMEQIQKTLKEMGGGPGSTSLGQRYQYLEDIYNAIMGDLDRLQKDIEANATVELDLFLEGSFTGFEKIRQEYRENMDKVLEIEGKLTSEGFFSIEDFEELESIFGDLSDEAYNTAGGIALSQEHVDELKQKSYEMYIENKKNREQEAIDKFNNYLESLGYQEDLLNISMDQAGMEEAINTILEGRAEKLSDIRTEMKNILDDAKESAGTEFLQLGLPALREAKLQEEELLNELDLRADAFLEIVGKFRNTEDPEGFSGDNATSGAESALEDYFYILQKIEEKQREIDFLQKDEDKNLLKIIEGLEEKQKLLHNLNTARRKDLDIINNRIDREGATVSLLQEQADLKADIHATSMEWYSIEENIIALLEKQRQVLRDEYEDRADIVSEAEDYILKIIEKRIEKEKELKDEAWAKEQEKLDEQHEDRLEKYDQELSAFEKMIDSKRQAYEDQYAEEDYQEELAEKQREIADVQSQIARLSLRDDAQAQSKILELREDLADKQKDLSDFQRDYNREKTLENLDSQEESMQEYTETLTSIEEKRYEREQELREKELEEWNENFERRYSTAKKYAMAQEALTKGKIEMYKGEELELMNLEEAFIHYEDTFGKGMSTIGEQIKNDLIANLRLAQQEIGNLNRLSSQLGISSGGISENISLDENPIALKELANIKYTWEQENLKTNPSTDTLQKLTEAAQDIRDAYGIKEDTWSLQDVLKILSNMNIDYKPTLALPTANIGSSKLTKDLALYAHQGEAIIPKDFNPFNREGFVNLLRELNANNYSDVSSNNYLIDINVDGVLDATVIPNLTDRINTVVRQIEKDKVNTRKRKQIL